MLAKTLSLDQYASMSSTVTRRHLQEPPQLKADQEIYRLYNKAKLQLLIKKDSISKMNPNATGPLEFEESKLLLLPPTSPRKDGD